jgi:hypothetical protein
MLRGQRLSGKCLSTRRSSSITKVKETTAVCPQGLGLHVLWEFWGIPRVLLIEGRWRCMCRSCSIWPASRRPVFVSPKQVVDAPHSKLFERAQNVTVRAKSEFASDYLLIVLSILESPVATRLYCETSSANHPCGYNVVPEGFCNCLAVRELFAAMPGESKSL